MGIDNFPIFALQVVLSFIVYGLVARWYIAPRLAALPLRDALIPLVLVHTLRHLGLTIMVPVVTDPSIPAAWAAQVGYGDLLAQILALLSVLALRARAGYALALVWILNIEGTLDLVAAFYRGFALQGWNLPLRSFWYVPTFIVPALLVTHYMMFRMLLSRSSEGVGAARQA